MVSDNFIEIAEIYNNRLKEQISQVKIEWEQIKVPTDIITAGMCYPLDYKKDINGKVVAIKADTLRPEYRRADKMLVLVTGGFGASANSRGNAVFTTNLYTGEHSRFERYDIQGEVKDLPDWAKQRLKEIQSEKALPTKAKKPVNKEMER